MKREQSQYYKGSISPFLTRPSLLSSPPPLCQEGKAGQFVNRKKYAAKVYSMPDINDNTMPLSKLIDTNPRRPAIDKFKLCISGKLKLEIFAICHCFLRQIIKWLIFLSNFSVHLNVFPNLFQQIFSLDNISNNLVTAMCSNSGGFLYKAPIPDNNVELLFL